MLGKVFQCWCAEGGTGESTGTTAADKIKAHIARKPRAWNLGTHCRKAELARETAKRVPGVLSGVCNIVIPLGVAGSSAQNGSALRREFSGGSYGAKRQPMASPSDGSLSSGGLDQGSDAPTRDYEREVSDSRRGETLRVLIQMRQFSPAMGLATSMGVVDHGEMDFLYFRLQKTLVKVSTLVLVFKMQKKLSVFLTWRCVGSETPPNSGPVE